MKKRKRNFFFMSTPVKIVFVKVLSNIDSNYEMNLRILGKRHFKEQLAVGSLVVMVSSFGPEGPGSIPDTAKDPPSKCGVLAR